MPSWTGEVCDRWGEMLDRLAGGPDRVAATLDWAIKLAIYRDRTRRRGFDWEALPVWTGALDAIERSRGGGDDDAPSPALSGALLRTDNRVRAAADALEPSLRARGCRWDQLDAFLALRRELFEIDTRWGQVGSQGVFAGLDRAGVLDHRVSGIDGVDEAAEHPPRAGRAYVRGTVIQRVRRERGHHCSSGWDHVWNHKTNSRLDLSDPFAETEQWVPCAPARPAASAAAAAVRSAPAAGDEATIMEEINRLFARVRPRARSDRRTDV
jgi:hypothetical protein